MQNDEREDGRRAPSPSPHHADRSVDIEGSPEGDPEETGVPQRGDVVEIPGEPLVVEYEQVRSAPPWLTPLVIAVVTLFAVFVVTRAAIFDEEEPIGLSQAPQGAVPSQLADGSVAPDLPETVTARFDAPVVGTRELPGVPEAIAEQCRTPFDEAQLDGAALERINEVISEGTIRDLRLGPEVVSVLRTGRADSPPRWPDTWALSCVGRYEDGGWIARPPRLSFARDGVGGASDSGPGVTARLTQVPAEATWAVQERDGWWLAAPVQPGSWTQVIVEGGRAADEIRVVFLNDEGRLVEDRRLTDPPPINPETAGEVEAGTIEVGPVDEVLAAVDEAPVRGCTEGGAVCVWVSRVGSELVAHAAYGPHHLDVPPFGEVGWCPTGEVLQGTVTRSQFSDDGQWRSGIADRGSTGFALRFDGGVVLVDLAEARAGEPAGEDADPAPLCVFTGEPVGEEPEDPEAIEQL